MASALRATLSKVTRASITSLIVAGAVQAAVVPREATALTVEVLAAAAALGIKPAVLRPTQQIEQVLAIGDSYTAGIGSNGLPDYFHGSGDCSRYGSSWPSQLMELGDWTDFNAGLTPDLAFGACSGATTKDLRDHQLQQGDPFARDVPYIPIGRPQIAVMTIGGNDVGFAKAVNDCIFRIWLPGDCSQTLSNMEATIASPEFRFSMVQTISEIIAKGQYAGGASPPQAFQLYVAQYIPFWNDGDEGCNDISWCAFYSEQIKLKTDLRLRMNHIVDQLNDQIHTIVDEFVGLGAVWVDGVSIQYNTHRFCEPAPPSYLQSPVGSGTWFWSWHSGGFESGSEGPDDSPSAQDVVDLPTALLDAIFPDPVIKATINEANPPWNLSPAYNSGADLLAALQATGNQNVSIQLDELTRRMFHPKGRGYAPYASAIMAAIRNNRNTVVQEAPPPPPPPPPAFAAGTCCFHINEVQNCNGHADDLFAQVTLVDNNKNIIYTTPQDVLDAHSGHGMPINDPAGGYFQGPLPMPVKVIGEHQNDYVQFYYGDLAWTSGTTTGPATCNAGGWDPKEGPYCRENPDETRKKQMDCCFPC